MTIKINNEVSMLIPNSFFLGIVQEMDSQSIQLSIMSKNRLDLHELINFFSFIK